MKTVFSVMLAAAAAVPGSAREVSFRKSVDPVALQEKLREEGYSVQAVECRGEACVIRLADSEKKDPLKIVGNYSPVPAENKRRLAELRQFSTPVLHEIERRGSHR
jgi:hypothetical protein